MLFPKNKLVPVKYIIDTESYTDLKTPKGIYPNIYSYDNNKKLGCPAVLSTDNKLFCVNSPISFDLEFGINNKEPYYKYNYDTKVHTVDDRLHSLIKNCLNMQYFKNTLSIQFLMPYAFITDNKDITVMTLPPPIEYNNCSYVNGEMYIRNWIRHLNAAFVLTNNDKPATVQFSVDKPLLMFVFNKQIKLEYTELTDKIEKYKKQNLNIVNYRKGILNYYEDIKSRRPKKLL